jgi:hypothetical protein
MFLAKCWDTSKQSRQVLTSGLKKKHRVAKKKLQVIYFIFFLRLRFLNLYLFGLFGRVKVGTRFSKLQKKMAIGST